MDFISVHGRHFRPNKQRTVLMRWQTLYCMDSRGDRQMAQIKDEMNVTFDLIVWRGKMFQVIFAAAFYF